MLTTHATTVHGVAVVNHDADFSGQARVCWACPTSKADHEAGKCPRSKEPHWEEAWLPGEVLLAVGRAAAVSAVASLARSLVEGLPSLLPSATTFEVRPRVEGAP